MKKSEIVRQIIAQSKSAGLEMKSPAVLDAVLAQTGLDKPLARTYIKNNWDKVVIKQPVVEATATAEAGDAPVETSGDAQEATAAATEVQEEVKQEEVKQEEEATLVAKKDKKDKKAKKAKESVAAAVGAAFEAAVEAAATAEAVAE